MQRRCADIFHRSDAHHRGQRRDGAAEHRLLEILLVIFGKGGDLLLKERHFLAGPDLKPFEPLADIGEEPGLRELAVGHDVDAALDLLLHGLGNRRGDGRIKRLLLVGLPRELRLEEIQHAMRARQAADMRRLDAVGILLQRHVIFLREEPRSAARGDQ